MSIPDAKKIRGTPKNDRDFPKKENKNGVKIKHVSDGAGLSLSIKVVVEDKTTPKIPESSFKNQDENLDGLDLRDLMKLTIKKNDSVLNQMSTLMEEFTNKTIKDAFIAINDSESKVVKHVKVIEDNQTYSRNSLKRLSGEQKQLYKCEG